MGAYNYVDHGAPVNGLDCPQLVERVRLRAHVYRNGSGFLITWRRLDPADPCASQSQSVFIEDRAKAERYKAAVLRGASLNELDALLLERR